MNNTDDLETPDKHHLCSQLDRHLDWIKSCDTKSSIVLAVVGIFLTIFTSEYSLKMFATIIELSLANINFSNVLYLSFLAVAFGSFIYGTYSLISVLTPRLSKEANVHENVDVNNSLYFFESISRNKFSEFKDKVYQRTPEDEINDILAQIYVNAKISTEKYKHYSKGILCVFLGIGMILILFAVGSFLVKVGGM
jgi:Family of unknown function (DUF5706)